ncbi:MAG: Lipoprotein, partial [Clostridium butyricum DORA_1]
RGLHLKSVAAIHLEPMGLYSKKITSLGELKDGSTIAVPNDPSNEARALKLLAANGLIKIKDGELVTPADITENPKNLQFSELEAAAVPRAVDDVDAAVINGNYAIEAGFDPTTNAIVKEDKDSEAAKPYANIIVVKEGNENLEKIQALIKALTSDEVRDFINKEYNGAVIPVF